MKNRHTSQPFNDPPTFYAPTQYQPNNNPKNTVKETRRASSPEDFNRQYRSITLNRPRLKIFDEKSTRSRSKTRQVSFKIQSGGNTDNNNNNNKASSNVSVQETVNKALIKKMEVMQKQIDQLNQAVGNRQNTPIKELDTSDRVRNLERMIEAKDNEIKRYQVTIKELNEELNLKNMKIKTLEMEVERVDRCARLVRENQYLIGKAESPNLDNLVIKNVPSNYRTLDSFNHTRTVSSFIVDPKPSTHAPSNKEIGNSPIRRPGSSYVPNSGANNNVVHIKNMKDQFNWTNLNSRSPYKEFVSPFNVVSKDYSKQLNFMTRNLFP